MFAPFVLVLALASVVLSSPLWQRREIRRNADVSLSNWGGFQSLNGFDDFNGVGNFDGSNNVQTVVVQEEQTVCEVQSIEVIQQKLVVLREMVKKVITEQICEVEVQTIVLEQFSSGIGSFSSDLLRQSGRQVGFDSNVASKISQLVNEDGSLSSSDLGFSGSDVGNNTVVAAGSNWNNTTSPSSVQSALTAAQAAAGFVSLPSQTA
ncbi:uncharacterized protein BT62DRAFT_401412 [Guyanagaster necrorhizus]|uniref:Uncharacterized protein n=1 Tax=Guyanagaster necrorhizus TaxID=856835 RepID=A0A9P8AYP8_9AGAR|nr:uncharacterized protein BT62DRAFT_401412 [Guyanagaster necrorhizus MCA 3950]KAG7451147.1 hypothetical protein BT62DRAFT_401412 [Guyanagaster necrorhizus MCA 3950]